MTPERRKQLDQAWLDSLLESAYQSPLDQREALIASVMQRLDARPSGFTTEATMPSATRVNSTLSDNINRPVGLISATPTRARWYSWRHLSALAIAASLLVLAIFMLDPADTSAYAAIARSAQAAPMIRHYRVQMIANRPLFGTRQATAQLYIDPQNRFVIEHPALMGNGTSWLGGDDRRRWIVPPRGPVIVGGHQLLGRWLARRDATTPYLHLTTILQRLSMAYQLSTITLETIHRDSGIAVDCLHIHGELLSSNVNLPVSIDLWTNRDSGIAERIILKWPDTPQRRGPVQWTIDLIATDPSLPTAWFELETHAPGRKAIAARTEDDLEHRQEQ